MAFLKVAERTASDVAPGVVLLGRAAYLLAHPIAGTLLLVATAIFAVALILSARRAIRQPFRFSWHRAP